MTKPISNTVNLLDFCKQHAEAFEGIFPIEWLSPIIAATTDGTINHCGFRNIIAARLENLQAVGIRYE